MDEVECLPCLKPGCVESVAMNLPSAATGNMVFLPSEDEECNICFSGELGREPAVQLECGHIFHAGCVIELLRHRWATLRITFNFMNCPQCKEPVEADHVCEILMEVEKLTELRSKL